MRGASGGVVVLGVRWIAFEENPADTPSRLLLNGSASHAQGEFVVLVTERGRLFFWGENGDDDDPTTAPPSRSLQNLRLPPSIFVCLSLFFFLRGSASLLGFLLAF